MLKLGAGLVFVISFAWATGVAAGGFSTATPELLAKGKVSYATNCAVCHGDKGDGNGMAGVAMNPKPRSFVSDKFKYGEKPEQVLQP